MSTPPIPGCDFCNRSGLSLLLLRPSPIAKDPRLAPPGSDGVGVDEHGLLAGLVPSEPLTESRYALRLLRTGFVHVYIPAPPPGMKKWWIYRVADNADLIEQSSPIFRQQPAPPSCIRQDHNASGMRLLQIPGAHEIGEVWIAYSANLWNERLRQRQEAEPQYAMQKVDLRAGPQGNSGTFQPTAEHLRSKVLECALYRLSMNEATDHDFPFVTIEGLVDDMAKQLTDLAALHPHTQGREMAVVLRDPVGVAAELNAIRLRRYELAEHYLLQPEIRQPLEVSRLIQTLKGNVIAEFDQRALDAVSPLRYENAFKADEGLVQGNRWERLSDADRAMLTKNASGESWFSAGLLKPYQAAFSRRDLGRVVFPDAQQRADAWAAAEVEVEKAWAQMTDYYDEEQRATWQKTFEADMQRLHTDELTLYEADWKRAIGWYPLYEYFELHFDPFQCNSPVEQINSGCSAGTQYVREVALSFTPEPYTDAPLSVFRAQLDGVIYNPHCVMQRAVVGNEQSLISILMDDKRDRTYDFMKGLLTEYVEAANHSGQPMSPRTAKTVSWLTNRTLSQSLGVVGVLASTAVALSVKVLPDLQGLDDSLSWDRQYDKAAERIGRAQGVALIHRASEEVLSAALNERAVRVPVVIMADCNAETAARIMRSRGEPMKQERVKELSRTGNVKLAIFTDSATLAELRADAGNLRDEMAKSAHGVHINERAFTFKDVALQNMHLDTLLTLPLKRFEKLYAHHRAEVAKAPAIMKAWMQERMVQVSNSPNVQAGRSAMMSLDGRLAIGSMIVQGLGVWSAMGAYISSGSKPGLMRDEWLNIANGSVCFLGGFLEFSTAAWQARLNLTVGATIAETRASLPFMRGAAFGMAFAANILSAWISFRDAEKLKEKGYSELTKSMKRSAVFFSAGSIPLGLVAADYVVKAAIKGGLISSGNVVAQHLGKVAAARIGTAMIGLSVPGVGWALTMIAVGQTVYVVMNMSGPVQHWLSGCYFGTSKWWKTKVPKRLSWEEELEAFNKTMSEMAEPEKSPEATPND